MKVSVIIPVYNVEQYVDRCLASVESQTYQDAEIIIVNDGSTDRSLDIVEKFVSGNKNFVCYTTKNSGLGGARNFGLSKASGDYIVFLDSDDYIEKDCLEKFVLAAMKNNSDIVVCNTLDVNEEGEILFRSQSRIKNETTSLKERPDILFDRFCAWGKMYRKSLFEGLEYVPREWYEDLRLTPKLYLRAERITFIEDFLFFYVQRAGSIMNNANAKRNLEIIAAFEDLFSYFKKVDAYEKFREELEYLVIEHLAVAAITRVVLSRAPERRAVLEELQEYLSGFDGLYQNKYRPHLGKNKALILFFNRNRLYLFTEICMKLKNKIKG